VAKSDVCGKNESLYSFVLVVENQVDGFVLDKCQTNVRKFFRLVRALAVSFVGKTNEV